MGLVSSRKSPHAATCHRRRTCCSRRLGGFMSSGGSRDSASRRSRVSRSGSRGSWAAIQPPRRAPRRRGCLDSSITSDSRQTWSRSSIADSTRAYTPADFPTPAVPRQPIARRRPRRRSANTDNAIQQAHRYLAAIPPAIAGQRGEQTFRACCRLVRGFAWSDDEALESLGDFNARCVPPWSERELLDKLRRARAYGREPVGELLTDSAP